MIPLLLLGLKDHAVHAVEFDIRRTLFKRLSAATQKSLLL